MNCSSKQIFFILVILLVASLSNGQNRRAIPSGNTSLVKPLSPKVNVKVFTPFIKPSFIPKTTSTNGTTKILFDIDLGNPSFQPVDVKNIRNANGKAFSIIEWQKLNAKALPSAISVTGSGKAGAPDIPCIVIPIAIPLGVKDLSLVLDNVDETSYSNTFLVPCPKDINDSVTEIVYDPFLYTSASSFAPKLSEQFTMRTMRMVVLTIPLVTYEAQAGKITAKTHFRGGVSFTGGSMNLPGKSNDPLFSDIHRVSVANPSDIERFKVPFHAVLPNVGQLQQSLNGPKTFDRSVTDWIDQTAPYIKLAVTRTGLYRATAQEISERGKFTISSWLARDVRLFNKGKEVPIWIDTTASGNISAIEFFGNRLSGFKNEYYNWTTDSNAYWLTNSQKIQTSPVRFIPRAVTTPPSQTLREATITLHHERDYDYYAGANGTGDETANIHRTDWVPGERFIWRQMRDVGSVIFDTIRLSAFPQNTQGKTARFSLFVSGVSNTEDTNNYHICQCSLNGTRILDVKFANYDSTFRQVDVPVSLLKAGDNIIELRYASGTARLDQWYVDYYAVALPSPIVASVDTAIAFGQYDLVTEPTGQIQSLEFSDASSLSIYNLSDGARLLTTNLQGGSFIVTDSTLLNNPRYVAASSSSFLKPDRVVAWNVSGAPQWADILDTNSADRGADYIIITHPEFIVEAQKLATFRKNFSHLRTKVVTTDEIYNTFNFGSDEPWAIRRFLQYAYDFYPDTPPGFVTLLGDGTWDPKFNLNNPYLSNEDRTNHRSFIHPYGIPSSDYIFTTLERTGAIPGSNLDTLVPQMVITRIPIESPLEGEKLIQKIVEYEGQSPAEWNKNFLLTIGGDGPGSSNPFEHGILLQYAESYRDLPEAGGLGIPPIAGKVSIVERTDFSSGIDLGHVPDLQSAFRRGQSIAYFFGHGASFTSDVFFGDPSYYRNSSLYPVFITLSCRTGAFAERNQITVNEGFLRAEKGGVIMALGSTGYDGRTESDRLSYDIFNYMRGDSLIARTTPTGPHKLNMAQIFTQAKFLNSVWQPIISVGAWGWYNSLQQNSILGDAPMGFVLRPQPEFNVVARDIVLTDKDGIQKNVFSVSDTFIIAKVKVSNYGYSAETPIHISISDEQPGGRTLVLIDTLARLDSNATVGAIFTLDSFAIGANTLRIKIDNDNLFAETEENDNEASLQFQVNGFSATPFFPPEGAKAMCDIGSDSVRFTALVPIKTGTVSQIEIEVDTTVRFNSPPTSLGTHPVNGFLYDLSVPRTSLPKPTSGVIWWRSRLISSGGNPSPWQVASLDLRLGGKSSFAYSTADQLGKTIISGVKVDANDGALYIPATDTIIYDVLSQSGKNLSPVSQIIANSRPLAFFSQAGLAVAYLTVDGSGLENNTLYAFPAPDPLYDSIATQPIIRSFDSLIASIPLGRKVIVFGNLQPVIPYFSFTDSVKNAMLSIGSTEGLRKLAFHGAYALIGVKGGAPGSAKEVFGLEFGANIELFDTIVTAGSGGSARTPICAVATRYGALSWIASNVATDSSLRFKVLGQPRNGGGLIPIRSISANAATSSDLSDIDPIAYPRIAIEMNFARSQSTTLSPRLQQIAFEYDPAPEFVIEENSLTVTPNKGVEEGVKVVSNYTVKNILCIPGVNVPITLTRNFKGKTDTAAKPIIANFAGRSQVSFTDTLATTGYQGEVRLSATVNPGATINEQLAFNNSSSSTYSIGRDTVKPKIDVLFDRTHISSGDYVSSKVEIDIRLSDKSAVRISDSTSITGVIQMLVNGATAYYLTGKSNDPDFTTTFTKYTSGDLQGELVIKPMNILKPGRYSLSAQAVDASGNTADTIEYEFVVSGTNGFEHVMNYPNPFKEKTYLTFILKSNGEADVTAVIYTVAGRKIRTLTLDKSHQRVGLNKLEWDGRDEEGNEVGNGTYLYRMVLNGKNADGSESSDAITERAVKSK